MASQLDSKHAETHTKYSDNENESYNIVGKVQVIEHIQPRYVMTKINYISHW